jgi:histidinol-phosphate/aromatic aminotransferase/cobyric acid decarboxylase-like protein
MDHWLRVTVGTVDENQLFVGALDAADEDPMSAEWH